MLVSSATRGALSRWWGGVKLGVAVVAAAIGVFWLMLLNIRRGRLDKAAAEAQDEARRVRDAGKRGATDEVVDSFRRATKK